MWKEMVEALTWHLPEGTEETLKTMRIVTVPAEI
jgi:hypothetical protein